VDILPGAGSSYAGQSDGFADAGGRLFFPVSDLRGGRERHVLDTSNNTFEMLNVYPGIVSANAGVPIAVGDKVYFAANHSTKGRELFELSFPPPPAIPALLGDYNQDNIV